MLPQSEVLTMEGARRSGVLSKATVLVRMQQRRDSGTHHHGMITISPGRAPPCVDND